MVAALLVEALADLKPKRPRPRLTVKLEDIR
jgi:hypothetical protein